MQSAPPPLPPRSRSPSPSSTSQTSHTSLQRPRADTVHLTPYTRSTSQSPRQSLPGQDGPPPRYQEHWSSDDPRSSSQQSLLPVESAGEGRRKLLLIYIHGFMGNETSFKSFPAHLHNILTVTLAESHVVHTKIYARYKSRRAIGFARDDFSNWLWPHESPSTDVILLGHSLGGILAAEVALLPSHTQGKSEAKQHRILGVMAFDTPFLGMHPGVVATGIASLFRGTPERPEPEASCGDTTSRVTSTTGSVFSPSDSVMSDPFSPPVCDPNFNPPFPNDVVSPQRKFWDSTLHFINKHSDGLTKASKQYVMSHLEFGGCLADYPGLKSRYKHIRALEDLDDSSPQRDADGKLLHRVRFVNYYSASSGRPKQRKTSPSPSTRSHGRQSDEVGHHDSQQPGQASGRNSGLATPSTGPRFSIEEHTDDGVLRKSIEEIDPIEFRSSDEEFRASKLLDSGHLSHVGDQEDGEIDKVEAEAAGVSIADPDFEESLPPIPAAPDPPPYFDASKYSAKDGLKVAQKEHARQVKAYERAKKDREKTIREREKMVKKRAKLAQKQQEKELKLAKKQQQVESKENLKRSVTLTPETYDKQVEEAARETELSKGQVRKKQRDRKFCALPTKDPRTGRRDWTWIRVYMEGVDEVVAHTTLFSGLGEPYEKLVGDAATRIEEWIRVDRMMREESAGAH